MKLTTPVDVGTSRMGVSFGKPAVVVGSCFAENIGGRMEAYGFPVVVNPFGAAYNPLSVHNGLRRLSAGREFTAEECVAIGAGDGRICTFDHHTRHSRPSAEEFLAHANAELRRAHDFWRTAEMLIVTLGTAWCFRHDATGRVVANCLKRPAAEFTRFKISADECAETLGEIATVADGRQIILTVSPIRHLADGAHGNALSKATLLLGVDKAVGRHCSTMEYFPSYEIVMDELRDYRFYADDMTHPSQMAERYIFDRFMDFALPDEERPRLAEAARQAQRAAHRTMRPPLG